jgi:hypothetical protein
LLSQELKLTSAQARSIFASACFLVNVKVFVRPKSRRMGLKGGSLLTKKLPVMKINRPKYKYC